LLASWDHEGGTNSTPTTGHAKFWRDEAAKSQHDPAAAIEDHVAWNPTALEQKIEATITTFDGALKTACCGRGEPSGDSNPTTVYLKDSSANPTAFLTDTWSEGAGGGTPNGCQDSM